MKKIKKLIILLLIFIAINIIIPGKIYAEENLENIKGKYGISDFLEEAQKYNEDLEISEIFNSSLSGKFDNNKILKFFTKHINKNLKQAILTLSGIIIIVIINSILKAISENLGNENVSNIAFYVQYILIVTLIMKNFSDVIVSVKSSIQNLNTFSNALIPLMTTLMIATGNITTSSVLEPILIFIVTFIGNFISNVLIPIILVSTAIGIISKVSSQVQITKLSNFMKKSSTWILTTVLAIFISIASLEGGLTGSLDGITKKASKSVISAVVPVVGNILGDAVETILGYSNIIKNAVGIVGILIITGICIKPIISLAMLTITYYLGAALCEPIADERVVGIIEQMASTFKTLLAVMFSATTMIIVGLALVMKITS